VFDTETDLRIMKSVLIILTIILSTTMTHAFHGGHGNSKSSGLVIYHNSFELPQSVTISLANRYNHFDLIHTGRAYHRGRLSFNLVIQHRSSYVRITIGDNGRYYGETYIEPSPLENHYCDEFCSFQYQHYENGHFASYDPYFGCDVHMDLIISRYPDYTYRPYYGYGFIHYHPKSRIYKRFRNYDHPYASDYYLHRRPHRYRHHKGPHGRDYGGDKGNHYGNHDNRVYNGRNHYYDSRFEKKHGKKRDHDGDHWKHDKDDKHNYHGRRYGG